MNNLEFISVLNADSSDKYLSGYNLVGVTKEGKAYYSNCDNNWITKREVYLKNEPEHPLDHFKYKPICTDNIETELDEDRGRHASISSILNGEGWFTIVDDMPISLSLLEFLQRLGFDKGVPELIHNWCMKESTKTEDLYLILTSLFPYLSPFGYLYYTPSEKTTWFEGLELMQENHNDWAYRVWLMSFK